MGPGQLLSVTRRHGRNPACSQSCQHLGVVLQRDLELSDSLKDFRGHLPQLRQFR